jgi:hypothetical protein
VQLLLLVCAVGVGVALTTTRGSATGIVVDGFLLSGTAQNGLDPENSANEVIKVDNSLMPGQCAAPTYLNCPFGTVSRKLNVKIDKLDNMLEFKSYFQDRTCGGGSPRIQLAIDLNGDGVADGNAFGYTAPPFSGCAPNRWQYDDVTDEVARWDVSQLVESRLGFPPLVCPSTNLTVNALCGTGGFKTDSGYVPWYVFETVLTTLFPNHKVCSGALVDDSPWFSLPVIDMPPPDIIIIDAVKAPFGGMGLTGPLGSNTTVPLGGAGVAFYDIITLGRATWEEHEDSFGRGFAKGCGAMDHGDSEVDGDRDHDYDCDAGDKSFEKDRHDRWGGR